MSEARQGMDDLKQSQTRASLFVPSLCPEKYQETFYWRHYSFSKF